MKRENIQNTRVIPCANGDVIDRAGMLSAVFAAKVTAGTKVAIAITHSDTSGGSFTPVTDQVAIIGPAEVAVTAPQIVNFDIDLIGCKQFIKITATLSGSDADATYAIALGDAANAPV